MTDSDFLSCYRHPDRKTLLRCNQCERPICTQCAILTPTGYRCRECVQNQQKKFETAGISDFILSLFTGTGLSFLGSYLPSFLGFFTLFIAPLIGTGIGEVIRKLTGNRRSRNMFILAAIGVLAGSLPPLISKSIFFLVGVQQVSVGFYSILPLIWQLAYTILVTSSIYYRLTGIKIG